MAKLEHNFNKDCPLRTQYPLLLIGMAFIYLVLTLLWYFLTWVKFREHSFVVQKILIVIIIFKIQTCLLGAIYSSQCPWEDVPQAQYIEMAIITTITIQKSTEMSILIILGKGWMYVKESLSHEDMG